jgi:low molecular weight protein-tyrosine phosphatase
MRGPAVPPRQGSGPYRVHLVCLGNICRSPMAHVVLVEHLERAGLAGAVVVTSSGTGDWHVGNPMDTRAAATLLGAGYDGSLHRASQWDPDAQYDLALAMDHDNLAGIGGRGERRRLFRDFDPVDPGRDVPDPYYGGHEGFLEVLAMVERTSASLVDALQSTLGESEPGGGAPR